MKFFTKKIPFLLTMFILFGASFSYSQIVSEDFEAGLPAGWVIINNGTGNDWTTQTAGGNNAPGCMRYAYTSASAADAWVITSGITLTAGQSVDASIFQKVQSGSYPENMKMTVGTGATVADQTTTLWDGPSLTNTAYEEHLATFVAPSAGMYYFGFQAYSAADQWNLFFDDFVLDNTPACPSPSAGMVNSVTSTSAEVTWTDNASASAWNIEYGADGFAQGSGTVEAVSSLPFTISGLTAETDYDFYYQADCGGGTSDWVGPVSFFTGYCTPAPSSVDGSGITNVGFGSGANVVANATGAEPGNYGNYSAMIGDMPQGVTGDIAITYATGYTYGTIVWVDWNDDLDFDDAGEQFPALLSSATNPTTLMYPLAVPAGATLGQHRLRIGGTDDDGGPSSPCYTGSYGSFEDYTINVVTPPACLPPNSGAASNITATSASLDWTEAGTATAWEIEYGVTGFTATGTGVSVSSKPHMLGGLTGETSYDVYYRSDCGGSFSTWSGPFTFETLIDCATSTNEGSSSAGSVPYFFANSYSTTAPSVPSNYWIDPAAHTEISAWTIGGDDDGYFTIPDLGFDFPYFGTDYRTGDIHINTNGQLVLGTGSTSTGSLSTGIQLCAMDLDDISDGKIYYDLTASRAVITWWHYHDYNDASEWITGQIVLYPNGVIHMNLNDTESTVLYAGSTTIGDDCEIGLSAGAVLTLPYRDNGVGGPMFCSPITIAFGPDENALPIELKSFTGKAMDAVNMIEWTTATEKDVQYHIIERSTDGINWVSIGQVAGQLDSKHEVDYEYIDSNPVKSAFYRLKTIDLDESNQLSDIISIVRSTGGFGITNVYPSPAKDNVNVQIETNEESDVYLRVTDLSGRVVVMQQVVAFEGLNTYNIALKDLAAGTYMISILEGGVVSSPFRIVKQ